MLHSVSPEQPEPRAFLLTYNPVYWFWPTEDRNAARALIANGSPASDQWNTGSRRGGMVPGDHVFVLQQGAGPRGLVAQGYATSEIYQAPHWDGVAGHVGNYVDVAWTTVRHEPYADIIDLRIAVDGMNWAPRQSGLMVPPHATAALLQFSALMLEQGRG